MNLGTKNFVITLCGSLAGAGSSIIISVALNRALGPEGRGILTQIILWPPIIANIIHAGWAIGITSRVSTNPDQLVGISSSATKLGTLLSVIGIGACYIGLIANGSKFAQNSAALLFLLYIPLATYECVNRALLEGSHKFKETSIVRGSISILTAMLISIVWLFSNLKIEIYIIICISTLALSSLIQLFIIRKNTKRNYFDILVGNGNNEWLKIAIKAIPYVLITIIVTRFDLIILTKEFHNQNHEVGLYVAASSIGSGITLIAQSIVYALIPRVSGNGEFFDPKKSSIKLSIVLILTSIIIAIIIVPFGELLMRVLFGENFKDAETYILPSIAYTTTAGLITIHMSQDAAEGNWKQASFTLCLLSLLFAIMFVTVSVSTVSGLVYLLSAILATTYITINILNKINDN